MRKTLPRHAKAAVGMDVALLDADSDGAYQAVVAVAAIDVSLTILTIDYHGQTRNSLSHFHTFATYYDVGIIPPTSDESIINKHRSMSYR